MILWFPFCLPVNVLDFEVTREKKVQTFILKRFL